MQPHDPKPALTLLVLCGAALLLLGSAACDGSGSQAQQDAASGSSSSDQATTQSAAASRPPGTRPATQPSQGNGASDKLTGTWEATGVDASMGDVRIRVNFTTEGPVRVAAFSEMPFVGQVRDMRSPYHVENGTIVAPEIRGGVTMPYHFEGDTLVLEYKPGQIVRFKKVAEED